MQTAGKVALVTGAGSGIGRAIALRLARAGASVVVNDISRHGQRVVREIALAGGRAAFVRADVAVEGDVRRMIAFAKTTFGGLDILVNNAGCALPDPAFPDAAPKAVEPHHRCVPARRHGWHADRQRSDAQARRRRDREHRLGRGRGLYGARRAGIRRGEGGRRAAHGGPRVAERA